MDPKKRCLLLVDLQNEFLSSTGNFPIAAASQSALLENVSKAAQDFRSSGDAVFWVRSEYTIENTIADVPTDGGVLRRTHTGKTPCCEPNSIGAAFPESVTALIEAEDIVVTKKWYSAFTETTMRDELAARGITHVCIGGLLTNVCVRGTADEAHALGFAVTVLEDCLGWRNYKSHDQALRSMRERGIQVAARHQVLGTPAQEPVLYYVNGSIPSWRVLMALYEKEIPFTAIRLRVMSDPKETRSATFLDLNHRGKTPVFVDPVPRPADSADSDMETVTINESIAILHYIEMYHRPERPLLPHVSKRSGRALALARTQETENLHNIYDALEDAHFEAEKRGERLEPDQRAELVAHVCAELDYWEIYASRSAYIAGNEFGLADCAFFPLLGCMVHRGFDWGRPTTEEEEGSDAWPHLRAYFERVWERGRENGCAKRAQPAGWDKRGKANVWTGTRGKYQ
ncbi:Isochorismatase-like protein [Mycena vulgaris]|nr:Isochorismatase-like protein [Mycena vulgaris]